jgi:hypothetical protein
LQAMCQIVIDHSECLRSSIFRSLNYDIHGSLIYLTYNTSLLLVIFIWFHCLDIITSYDHSKIMIELNGFDRSKTWEILHVNISICSMKIKIMLTETPSEQIIGHSYEPSVISHQSRLPILRSSLRPLRRSSGTARAPISWPSKLRSPQSAFSALSCSPLPTRFSWPANRFR